MGLLISDVLSILLIPKLVFEVAASTYVLTAFCVGNKTSLVPSVVVTDLLAVFSLSASSDCETVLLTSAATAACLA